MSGHMRTASELLVPAGIWKLGAARAPDVPKNKVGALVAADLAAG